MVGQFRQDILIRLRAYFLHDILRDGLLVEYLTQLVLVGGEFGCQLADMRISMMHKEAIGIKSRFAVMLHELIDDGLLDWLARTDTIVRQFADDIFPYGYPIAGLRVAQASIAIPYDDLQEVAHVMVKTGVLGRPRYRWLLLLLRLWLRFAEGCLRGG